MADAAGLIAVTDPLADEVARRFGVARPTVVMNCRPRWRADEPGLPVSGRLRDAIAADRRSRSGRRADPALPGGVPRGPGDRGAAGGAGDAAAPRPVRCVTVFLGFGRLEGRLREAAAADARAGSWCLPPVPSAELLEWTAGATLSFVGAPPKTINLRLTIPNKLFESLMAGVPVVVSGGTAVARHVVGAADVGVVVEPWSSAGLADALAAALDEPEDGPGRPHGRRARAAALERYNWRDRTGRPGRALPHASASRRREGRRDPWLVTHALGRLLLNNPFVVRLPLVEARHQPVGGGLRRDGRRARAAPACAEREERDGYRVVRLAPATTACLAACAAAAQGRDGADAEAARAAETPGRRGLRGRRARHPRTRRAGRPLPPAHQGLGAVRSRRRSRPSCRLDAVDIWQSEGHGHAAGRPPTPGTSRRPGRSTTRATSTSRVRGSRCCPSRWRRPPRAPRAFAGRRPPMRS